MPLHPPTLFRKLLFTAILTAATLVVFLGGLEAALRLIGYGDSPHLARRVRQPNGEVIWRENRNLTAPFFSPALARRPLPFRLPEKKAPGTYRIFILGSSAAMGDPEPSFSLGRTLEAMLRAAYPKRNFEVINAAVTAINSHLVRGIAEDCAGLEPDLFIVYEGNNEVIGPFGPTGVFAPFLRSESAVRFLVHLKSSRTGQLLAAVSRSLRGQKGAPTDWGGMQMFVQQQIASDDPRLETVRAHFDSNLRAIVAAAHSAGARTLLCTVATNQRDFAPFLSVHRAGLSSADLARWDQAYAAGDAAARGGDLNAARTSYEAALALDDRHADLVFRLGRLALQAGQLPEAHRLLQRALDLDTLRFRTDSTLNQVIRTLGAENLPGVEIVDLARALDDASPGGIAGDEFLYEHVHLTLRGTYEAAARLFPRVISELARRRLIDDAAAPTLSYDEIRNRLAYTTHEQAMIALELINRFRKPPFSGQADQPHRLAVWERRAANASTLLQRPDALPALKEIYRQALEASPKDWILARNAGAMLVARGAPAEAVPLLEKARSLIDNDVDTLVALGWAYRALGQATESETAFAQARSIEPNYPNLPAKQPSQAGK